jgi:sulfate adenylyltransferase
MQNSHRIEPHGGRLVELLVDPERVALLKDVSINLAEITLNERQLCDLELLSTGAFSPLDGFMVRADYESVLDRMRLQNDVLWPIPVCLDVTEAAVQSLEAGQSAALRDAEGYLLAIMHVEDIWPIDKEKEAKAIYGTMDASHPGVEHLLRETGTHYIGGRLEVLSLPLHFDFKSLRHTPREVRRAFDKLGWTRVAGFQTENPIHRPGFEMTMRAMEKAKANLLLLPVVGMGKPGDFDHYTRVRCYREVTRRYPPDSIFINLLPLSMRLAGSRDALLHSIIAKNYGCSHFIVGRDHASPGRAVNGEPFYEKDAACELAENCSDELGVNILALGEIVYLPMEDEFLFAEQVPEGTQTISITGSDIRNRIRAGRHIPDWMTFPEVIGEIYKAYPPPRRQGVTLFLTGLSGAGKSTIARILYAKFLELGDRPATLLDGDIVRHNLSSELNFTKEHRDINVRRIGFVASEITKNRGIAICAPIAPYANTRRQIRKHIEQYGGFVEVHVATPIDVCEKRDRKGMYAKARAGMIKGFTGVDDPYEVPENAEVQLDTTHLTPGEAVQEILFFLGRRGYI